MSLTGKQRHFLRGLAHHRKPIVTVSDSGLTENVMHEIDQALAHHELIKVKLRGSERDERQNLVSVICEQASCEAVQIIGQIAVFYRPGKTPAISLPR
jgi:RNA-binding protein